MTATNSLPRIARKIITERKKLAETQVELAEAVGVQRRAVERWETGDRCPQKAQVEKLADHFGMARKELEAIAAPERFKRATRTGHRNGHTLEEAAEPVT